MMKATVLRTILITFLCSPQFVLSNSTGVDQNIVTSSKTNTNISNKVEEVLETEYNNGNSVLEPSIDIKDDLVKDDLEKYKQPVISNLKEDLENSKNVLNNDTPVILTLSESSTIELEKLVDAPLVSTSTKDENQPKNNSVEKKKSTEGIKSNITHFSEEIPPNKTATLEDMASSDVNKNVSVEQNEEIPSFSEWAQKRLEEVEKNEQINSSAKGQAANGKATAAKLRWKNYASLDCGAKVIAANPESVSPGAILSPSSDEYKLNTCTSRIWFVVELCEAIQTKKIDLANYELFSSSPKDFVVSVSDRYPTRDWSVVGKFTAKDERDIQSFDLDTQIFGKYIKVEIKSHYGSEHYCPISLFRAYGTSVFEVLQKEDPGNVNPTEDDDDDDDDDNLLSTNGEHDESQKNLFSSATDAVMSIVKRAAEVLGNKVNNRTIQKTGILNSTSSLDSCSTPCYMVLCKNCSDKIFQQVYETVSCDFGYVRNLLEIPLIYKAISGSWICRSLGYDVDPLSQCSNYIHSFTNYVTSFLPFKYIRAMCHEVSVIENRAVLNISQQFANKTGNITTEQVIHLKVQEPHIGNVEHKTTNLEKINGTQSFNTLNLTSTDKENMENDSEENTTYVSQIKPTKTLTSEVQISQTDINSNRSNTTAPIQSSEKTLSSESSESVSGENFNEGNLDTTTEMEGMEALEDHLEHLISDFNSDSSQNIASTTTTTTTTPQAQKESVFLRLSNRIKVLERNMSLSSQYLEELSRRYKKQVEEMQHLLEKTIATLREEAERKDLRNKQLEDRLDNLTAMMESLVAERHNWILSIYCLMTSVLVLSGIYFFCRKSTTYIDPTRENKETAEVLRRKSIDIVTHRVPVKKKRRPSDQALKIVRCCTLNAEEDRQKHNSQRQKKRKKRNLIRSHSNGNIKEGATSDMNTSTRTNVESVDWLELAHRAIDDIPFALDESDNTTLEAYPLETALMRSNSTSEDPTTPNSKPVNSSSQNHESHNVSHEEVSNHTERSSSSNTISVGEPVKKEKRSFKRLLKKVF